MANESEEFWKHFHKCAFVVSLKSGARRPFILTERLRNLDEAMGEIAYEFSGNLITRGLSEKHAKFSFEYLSDKSRQLVPRTGFINARSATLRNSEKPLFMAVWGGFKPARQYRKGVNDEELLLTPMWGGYPSVTEKFDIGVNKYGARSTVYKAYLIGCAVNEPYHHWFEALDMINEGKAVSSAISRFFALGTVQGVKYPILYYKSEIGGVVTPDGCFVTRSVFDHSNFFMKRFGVELKLGEWYEKHQ